MLTNRTKSFLTIILNLKPSPHFFISYIVIWFVWHNDFILALVTTNVDFGIRLQAVNRNSEFSC